MAINNMKIAVCDDDINFIDEIKIKFPSLKLVEVDSVHDGLTKVAKGEIFGYIDNNIVIIHEIHKYFIGTLAITGKADITLADFWGIENIDKAMDQDLGTSLIIEN